MKNVQIIDGGTNATYSIFAATDDEFAAVFPDGRDMELAEDLFARLGDDEATRILTPIWDRPVLKRDASGIHGTLFFDNEDRVIPVTKREVDCDPLSINAAQRALFVRSR